MKLTEHGFMQRLFGTSEAGVLYLEADVLKEAKIKPGDKLRISIEENGLKVQKVDDSLPPKGGQP